MYEQVQVQGRRNEGTCRLPCWWGATVTCSRRRAAQQPQGWLAGHGDVTGMKQCPEQTTVAPCGLQGTRVMAQNPLEC